MLGIFTNQTRFSCYRVLRLNCYLPEQTSAALRYHCWCCPGHCLRNEFLFIGTAFVWDLRFDWYIGSRGLTCYTGCIKRLFSCRTVLWRLKFVLDFETGLPSSLSFHFKKIKVNYLYEYVMDFIPIRFWCNKGTFVSI